MNSISIFTETYRYLQLTQTSEQSIDALKMNWSKDVLAKLNVDLSVVGTPTPQNQILFVGNHISYLDIPLLMSIVPGISFVAKSELKSWPVFGSAAKKIDTVFVTRESNNSRNLAKESIKQALLDKKRVVIFPSGTTCTEEAKPWRKGAFEIAKASNTMIQPFRISYSPLRAVAYIDKDFFPTHLYNLFAVEKIKAQIEFHTPVEVIEPVTDCLRWHYWSRGLLDVANN
jgi:1-acyl-sn-glycerol-3-phosphate acyltransferase